MTNQHSSSAIFGYRNSLGAKLGPTLTVNCSLHPKSLLRSAILVRFPPRTNMLSPDLFHGRPDWNIIGCFGTILARSWHLADDPPAHSDLGAQVERLFLLLSDQSRVRAAGLHAAYNHCRSQITNDQFALETLEQQHYNMQCCVTPFHRLPAEILTDIFHIALDVGQLRTGLMQVCRRWCIIIEGMASVWSSLDLGAGTTPERVQYLLSRAGTQPLAVKIDTSKAASTAGELHSSLSMAGDKASQWRTLTITSLSHDEPDAQSDHALTSMRLQPMTQLRHLNIRGPELSPLPRLLLQNVATTAVGRLVSMEIHSLPAIQYLLQPVHVSIFSSLTTFIAKVPTMSRSIDLLPHFIQLEVLDLTNLHLPTIRDGSPLPLAHVLRHLRLKAVSIEWMGGQVFSQLEDCTIIAPLSGPSLDHDVHLPACIKLHFENWDISPIGQFLAPALDHLRVKSNAWSPYNGTEQVLRLVRAGFGMTIQPKSLSLDVVCKEKVLLAVLQLLPGLVKLQLDLPRPSALGAHFFTGLLAKPGNQGTGELKFDWRELFRKNNTGWRCTVCPSLRILELRYQRWIRHGDSYDFLPLLYALRYSREKAATPLQLQVHFNTSLLFFESWDPRLIEAISSLKIPQHDQITHLSLRTNGWNNTVYENALFIPYFCHLQILEISIPFNGREVVNVLPFCHELRELKLLFIDIPPLACDVDLPLVHTLQKLWLGYSTLAWLDGLVFTQLQRFDVEEPDSPETFIRKGGMPACTHIVFTQYGLKSLPLFQYNFNLPLLGTFESLSEWDHYDERVMSALQRIHAKRFKLYIFSSSPGLLKLLESKDEVEQLDLVIKAGFALPAEFLLTRMSVTNDITMKVLCPNMKVLQLQFDDIWGTNREQVTESCRQMMDNRRLAGYFLEQCYIWWDREDWEKEAPLTLVIENEVVRVMS